MITLLLVQFVITIGENLFGIKCFRQLANRHSRRLKIRDLLIKKWHVKRSKLLLQLCQTSPNQIGLNRR
ncbi:Uncharacterised protein [Vibrio cholerae]|nr:Uncharacterised protein [Vibrio cholerae]